MIQQTRIQKTLMETIRGYRRATCLRLFCVGGAPDKKSGAPGLQDTKKLGSRAPGQKKMGSRAPETPPLGAGIG